MREEKREIGLANTEQYVKGCGKGHDHPAAKEAYKTVMSSTLTNFSMPFLPSVGQWILVMKSFGFPWKDNTPYDYQENSAPLNTFKQKMADVGINYDETFANFRWTSTPKLIDTDNLIFYIFNIIYWLKKKP